MPFAGLTWYVSPNGSWRGDGSRERPWSLEKALSHPQQVEPGDVIFMLGGLYRPRSPLVCRLRGGAGTPVELRGDPESELVRIDTALAGSKFGLRIADLYVRLAGFELFNSSPVRWSDTPGGEGDPRGIGLLCEGGAGTELVDLIVRDFGTSLFESQPSGLVIRGCLFFNSYWDAPDRSHGPGLYVRNPVGAPQKRIVENVIFQHGRQGLQGFGSIPFANVAVEGNVFFNNGVARDGFHRNVMFGNASDDHDGVRFEDNVMYLTPNGNRGHDYNLLGGDGGSHGLEFTGNWVIHRGHEALRIQRADGLRVSGNRIFGGLYFSSFDGLEEVRDEAFEQRFPANEYFDEPPVGEVWVRQREREGRPDHWDGRIRLIVTVVNWAGGGVASVSLENYRSAGKLDSIETVQVCSVQDPSHWESVAVSDGAIEIPLTGWTPAAPAGRSGEEPLPETLPEFGVFWVEWIDPGWVAEGRSPQAMSDPAAGLPTEQRRQVRLDAWGGADSATRAEWLAQRRRAWRAGYGATGLGTRVRLRFRNLADANTFQTETEITAVIEGGAGPIRLGKPAVQSDGTAVISHLFTDADLDWIRAVADGIEIAIETPSES